MRPRSLVIVVTEHSVPSEKTDTMSLCRVWKAKAQKHSLDPALALPSSFPNLQQSQPKINPFKAGLRQPGLLAPPGPASKRKPCRCDSKSFWRDLVLEPSVLRREFQLRLILSVVYRTLMLSVSASTRVPPASRGCVSKQLVAWFQEKGNNFETKTKMPIARYSTPEARLMANAMNARDVQSLSRFALEEMRPFLAPATIQKAEKALGAENSKYLTDAEWAHLICFLWLPIYEASKRIHQSATYITFESKETRPSPEPYCAPSDAWRLRQNLAQIGKDLNKSRHRNRNTLTVNGLFPSRGVQQKKTSPWLLLRQLFPISKNGSRKKKENHDASMRWKLYTNQICNDPDAVWLLLNPLSAGNESSRPRRARLKAKMGQSPFSLLCANPWDAFIAIEEIYPGIPPRENPDWLNDSFFDQTLPQTQQEMKRTLSDSSLISDWISWLLEHAAQPREDDSKAYTEIPQAYLSRWPQVQKAIVCFRAHKDFFNKRDAQQLLDRLIQRYSNFLSQMSSNSELLEECRLMAPFNPPTYCDVVRSQGSVESDLPLGSIEWDLISVVARIMKPSSLEQAESIIRDHAHSIGTDERSAFMKDTMKRSLIENAKPMRQSSLSLGTEYVNVPQLPAKRIDPSECKPCSCIKIGTI